MIKKILPGIAIVILLLLIKGRVETISRLKNTGATKADIEKTLEAEKNSNLYLTERLKYVKSKDFIEKEARDKLSLAKKNEVLVLGTSIGSAQNKTTTTPREMAIWEKWLEILN